jgi:hypothetical protein
MNREYLLDSLDGFKALVFSLFPSELRESIGVVPMTTDGPWNDAEQAAYQKAIGTPASRTIWEPFHLGVVPTSTDPTRDDWINAVSTISYPYLFLDPDTGFYQRHTRDSRKMLLIDELRRILVGRKALLVYRHQYWPERPADSPELAYSYVWHGLSMLRDFNLVAFAYQSQSASMFFIATHKAELKPFVTALQLAFRGLRTNVTRRRLIFKDGT